MDKPLQAVDALRSRWERYRVTQRLTHDAREQFALGGLGQHGEKLDLRILFVPSDPESNMVPINSDTLAWLKEPRLTPYGTPAPSLGHHERATSSGLVLHDQYRDDRGWSRYIAVHRHGGIEIGASNLTYLVRDIRVFMLRSIIGLTGIAAALQAEACDQWPIQGPFELTVALRDTKGATLGDFAEGWTNPGQGHSDLATCLEDHLLLRREVQDAPNPGDLTLDLGDHIEQAFGTLHRRHLAQAGEYKGRFDPRFQI